MKKLMIAAAIVCAAAFANAATYYWSVKSEEIWQPGSDYGEAVASGTPAYLFMLSDTMTQETVLSAVRDGAALSSLAFAKELAAGSNDGKITATTFSTTVAAEGDKQNFFLAMMYGDQILLTDSKGGVGTVLQDSPVSISMETGYASGDLETLYGDKTWADVGDGNGGGYFNAAAVPEPTSGLLLLLGVAGLALRRRRA